MIKSLTFFIFLGLSIAYSQAQSFAPIGATWHYTEKFAFETYSSYLYIEATKDTVFKGKTCRVLENNGGLDCAFHNEMDFVYTEDSVVYIYTPEIDSFQVLYNFKAKKDSSWTIIFEIDPPLNPQLDTLLVTVDSVCFTTINDQPLKKLFVSYSSLNEGYEGNHYYGEILERLGDTYYLFHLYGLSGVVCDGNYSEGLRCYQDPGFGFYETGIADSCTVVSGIGLQSNQEVIKVDIYPNPTNGKFKIASDTKETLSLFVFDLMGQVIYKETFAEETTIDLSACKPGFYLISLHQGAHINTTRKLVLN